MSLHHLSSRSIGHNPTMLSFLPAVAGLLALMSVDNHKVNNSDFSLSDRDNGSALFPMRPCRGHQLEEASIDELQALMASGSLSSVDLVSCYLDTVYQTSSYLKYYFTSLTFGNSVKLSLSTK